MNKKVLIMVVVGLLAGVGGTAAFFMLGSSKQTGPAEVVEKPPGIVSMETFLVNINDPGGDRFAKLNLRLTVTPSTVADDITGDEILQARMRDRVLTLLTSKSLDELVGPIGKEGLRREIKTSLSPLVEEGEIKEVLFADFVVQ